jgi:hypothetical protein
MFVHYSSITGDGFRMLTAGQAVDYDEQHGPQGWFAVRVAVASTSPSAQRGTTGDRGGGGAPA